MERIRKAVQSNLWGEVRQHSNAGPHKLTAHRDRRTTMLVQVSYICASGGGGQTEMSLEELPKWLAERPGTLLHLIMPQNIFQHSELVEARKEAIRKAARHV